MKSQTGNTAVLVLSCDKNSDLWEIFFKLFFRYWEDCPYKIYLGTNEKTLGLPGVTTIQSRLNRNWSDETIAILEQMPEEYVIILLEDYFLYGPVDTKKIIRCSAMMEKMDAAFMRIACFPSDHFKDYAYDIIPAEPEFCVTRKEANYRVTLQAGIWNKKKLSELIRAGESPWDFEVEGTRRSLETNDSFLGLVETPGLRHVHGPIPYICSALTKGVWMRDAIALCVKENIPLDFSNRKVESGWKFIRRKIYHSMPFGSRKVIDFINKWFKILFRRI